MADKAPSYAAVLARLQAIARSRVKVGLLQDAGSTPDGTPLTEIGAAHEFGTLDGHIPQRSWLRSTFRRTHDARIKFTVQLVESVMKQSSMNVERALGLLGQWAVARVKETIVKKLTEGPMAQENKPATLAAKAPKTTPLIDTAQMKNAITYQVVKK